MTAKLYLPIEVKWPKTAPNNIAAFTTTRQTFSQIELKISNLNPSSTQNYGYDFFNLGDHVGDCSKVVANNRTKLLKVLPDNAKIQWLEQVHGNTVVTLNQHQPTPITADAVITQQKNLALAVMTADCLPILLTDLQGNEVAAIHGGWRPLASGIIKNTLSKMRSAPKHILAWLGPCIGPSHFEVGAEVRAKFIGLDPLLEQAFTSASNHKFLADLHLIATLQLLALGVTKISRLPDCTYTHANSYYSYRRENVTGRMASVVCRR